MQGLIANNRRGGREAKASAVLEEAVALLSRPYEEAVAKLEAAGEEFARKVSKRRRLVEDVWECDPALAALEEERESLLPRLGEAQLADDREEIKRLKDRARELRGEVGKVEKRRADAETKLSKLPGEIEMSKELSDLALRVLNSPEVSAQSTAQALWEALYAKQEELSRCRDHLTREAVGRGLSPIRAFLANGEPDMGAGYHVADEHRRYLAFETGEDLDEGGEEIAIHEYADAE